MTKHKYTIQNNHKPQSELITIFVFSPIFINYDVNSLFITNRKIFSDDSRGFQKTNQMVGYENAYLQGNR
ncbi:hypothetical protein [Flavobacterium sp.]|uniref:hypothetical protein n=1 Tax=Flavobacterium sp. TaxID=239 RepID=UPI003751DE9E